MTYEDLWSFLWCTWSIWRHTFQIFRDCILCTKVGLNFCYPEAFCTFKLGIKLLASLSSEKCANVCKSKTDFFSAKSWIYVDFAQSYGTIQNKRRLDLIQFFQLPVNISISFLEETWKAATRCKNEKQQHYLLCLPRKIMLLFDSVTGFYLYHEYISLMPYFIWH